MNSHALFAFLVATVGLTGCEPKPVDETHQGMLANGDWQHPRDHSWYDEYSFEAKQGWEIDIAMSSDDFDTFLELRRDAVDDATWLQQNDDISRSDRNSRITVIAPADGTYRVWANSFEFGESGAYVLTIKARPQPSPATSTEPASPSRPTPVSPERSSLTGPSSATQTP